MKFDGKVTVVNLLFSRAAIPFMMESGSARLPLPGFAEA
jgi:hypothetical protein